VNVNPNVAPHVGARTPSQAGSAGTLAFLYGVAGREELPGVALTRLMGDLGVRPEAVRVLLSRMRRAGELTGTRRGRRVDYRLAGGLAAGFRRVRDGADRRTPEWDGAFHTLLYQVPERHRAFRDALRRAAQLQGYGLLQQGVLIALDDRADTLSEVLDRRPEGAYVRRARLTLDPSEAGAAAATAWDLPALGAAYRAHIDRLTAATADTGDPSADAATLALLAELTTAPMTDTLGDPGLPKELLPGDWPLPELWRAIGRAHATYGPPAQAYVRTVLAESEG
jgi:phenylacetic acid degradation operon negative regulatory protein